METRMVYFNCEEDEGSMSICQSYDVTHYPTLVYHGVNLTPPRRNWAKFNGNVGVGEEVRDWILIMNKISGYERTEGRIWELLGWGKKQKKEKRRKQIEAAAQAQGSVPTKGGGGNDEEMSALNDALQAGLGQYDVLLSNLLLTNGDIDAFTYLNEVNWTDDIVKTCVIDTTVDYCSRYVDNIRTPLMSEDEVVEIISTEEPYCVVLDGCVDANMPDNYSCRPKVCPLGVMGCRYVGVCMEDDVKDVYIEAMGGEQGGGNSKTTE
jgi:hypothetical protein